MTANAGNEIFAESIDLTAARSLIGGHGKLIVGKYNNPPLTRAWRVAYCLVAYMEAHPEAWAAVLETEHWTARQLRERVE